MMSNDGTRACCNLIANNWLIRDVWECRINGRVARSPYFANVSLRKSTVVLRKKA